MDSDPRKKRRRSSSRKSRHSSSSRSSRRDGRSSSSGRSSKSRKRKEVQATSSFSKVAPSRAPVSFKTKKRGPAIWRAYGWGLCGVIFLILLSGGESLLAQSWALLLPGLALLMHPPKESPGVWIDRMALAFMACLLLAFVPQFYWPAPDWRIAAEESFGISLPFSLSIQPLKSFEAWLLGLGAFAWFYAASSWRINYEGRKWLFFTLSIALTLAASFVLWGSPNVPENPGTTNLFAFSFLSERVLVTNLFALGGVCAFGYAMCALRYPQFLPVAGFVAVLFCLMALIWSGSPIGVLLFVAGIFIWYFLHWGTGRLTPRINLGFILSLLVFCIFIVSSPPSAKWLAGDLNDISSEHAMLVAEDAVEMIQSAPLTGYGIGNFSTVFPQYRQNSVNSREVQEPGSDFLWLSAEAGIIGALLLVALAFIYFRRCFGFKHNPSETYRLAALVPLFVFILHMLVAVPGHRSGSLYLAILLGALALPQQKRRESFFKPLYWRICGGFLVLCGLLWIVASVMGLPLHSKVAIAQYETKAKESMASSDYEDAENATDKWIKRQPLEWRAYSLRAELSLLQGDDHSEAEADFERARFVEPHLAAVAMQEALVWAPFDAERTVAAWREAFHRAGDGKENVFKDMLANAGDNPELLAGLSSLSTLDTDCRVYFLEKQSGAYLMQELQRELAINSRLSHFTRSQRTRIVESWIRKGDLEKAEAFLVNNEAILERPWWLWSLVRKGQANFEEAATLLRNQIKAPFLPKVSIEDVSLERLKRAFEISPKDTTNRAALILYYIERGDFQKVQLVTDQIIAMGGEVQDFVMYWQAESLFRIEDYVQSWYAYERYLNFISENKSD